MCPLYLKQNSDTCDVMQRASARVLIAFNLNQKVIRVNQGATTADQDWWCKIREAAAQTMELAPIPYYVQHIDYNCYNHKIYLSKLQNIICLTKISDV